MAIARMLDELSVKPNGFEVFLVRYMKKNNIYIDLKS